MALICTFALICVSLFLFLMTLPIGLLSKGKVILLLLSQLFSMKWMVYFPSKKASRFVGLLQILFFEIITDNFQMNENFLRYQTLRRPDLC